MLNTVWSQRANFIEVPTDCPQRDERLGWTGDAQVFAGTACWLADSHAFLRKYLRDVMADQRAGRRGAALLARSDAAASGAGARRLGGLDRLGRRDRDHPLAALPALRRHATSCASAFGAMLSWLDYLWSISDGPIITAEPALGRARASPSATGCSRRRSPARRTTRRPRRPSATTAAATIYHFISTRPCGAHRRASLGERRAGCAARTRARPRSSAAFAHEFITPSGRIGYGDQTSYALALLYDLVPEEHREAAARQFRRVVEETDGRIGTGFIGTPALLPALTKLGMHDLAERCS